MKFGLSDDIYEKIKKIADKYNKYKFKIFGSRARGDYRSNSDIDIAIEGNIDKKDKFNIFAYYCFALGGLLAIESIYELIAGQTIVQAIIG